MKNKTIDQHTVPQTWLKHFTYNKNRSSVYVYSKEEEKPLGSKPIAKLTTHDNFYDFHKVVQKDLEEQGILKAGDNDDEQFVEKRFFSYNVENKLGPLLKGTLETLSKRTKDTDVLTKDQRIFLSIHFAIQFYRTSVMRRLIIRCLDAIKKQGYQFNIDEVKEFYHYLLLRSQKTITKRAEDMYNRNWVIYKTNSQDDNFVISDNPIVTQAVSSRVISSYCIPLSSEYLLVLYSSQINGFIDNTVLKALTQTVNDFNNLQYQQCESQIYTRVISFSWIEKDVEKREIGMNQLADFSEEFFESVIKRTIEKLQSTK